MRGFVFGFVFFALLFSGCMQTAPSSPAATVLSPSSQTASASLIVTPSPTVFIPSPTSVLASSNASDGLTWLYVLNGYEKSGLVQKIVETPSAGLVVDAFRQTPDEWFSAADVAAFKQNHSVVLAYVSIGEAEDYRHYWKPEWKDQPPAWLGRVNPQWEGNVKVKYWHPAWQAIVLDYARKVAEQGFDGVYLDIVDAYEYWSDEENGDDAFSDPSFSGSRNYLERDEAAARMIEFLQAIRSEGRKVNPDFLVFPQNAQQLVDYPGYLEAIDGVGREDTWYVGYDDRNALGSKASLSDSERLAYELQPLQKIKAAGKIVLVVDYFAPGQVREANDFMQKAASEGFFAYAADTRRLDAVSSLNGG